MAKRKREVIDETIKINGAHKQLTANSDTNPLPKKLKLPGKHVSTNASTTVQIVVGTYEKMLHGVTATLPEKSAKGSGETVEFADTFLFNAHASAIQCLAISPPSSALDATQPAKVILASGSSDQIINLYHISTSPPPRQKGKSLSMPSLTNHKITENPRNRELGSLQHHSSNVNALQFPTRSKLLSAADDNTIAVTRTRDWTVLSTIKAPIPKAHGRPSGDTAALGDTPAGVNDFAIHPSMKLMVSVGKGEKCMRLWNLVTGKKAGVLTFERDLLKGIGEGRWASGEGRKVEWNNIGEEFVVGFERGAAIFGMDSKPRCRILPSPPSKIHQLHYVAVPAEGDKTSDKLAVSTEDGRILFYSTTPNGKTEKQKNEAKTAIPNVQAIGQIGGNADDLKGRIKDFDILQIPTVGGSTENLLIVAGSSDGAIRLWLLDTAQLVVENAVTAESPGNGLKESPNGKGDATVLKVSLIPQVGQLLGTYETGNRITCLKAFIMSEPKDTRNITSKEEAVPLSLDQGDVNSDNSRSS